MSLDQRAGASLRKERKRRRRERRGRKRRGREKKFMERGYMLVEVYTVGHALLQPIIPGIGARFVNSMTRWIDITDIR